MSVRKARLSPPAPRLVGADQVAEVFQTNPAAHAKRLARSVRGLWARLTRTSRKATKERVFVGLLWLEYAGRGELEVALQSVTTQLEMAARRLDARESARRRSFLKTRLADRKTGLQVACGLLKPMRATPLATLRTASGEYTADPLEVDKIAAEAWDPSSAPRMMTRGLS
jgi:hypothetical protein